MSSTVSTYQTTSPHRSVVCTPREGLTVQAGINAPLRSTNRYQVGSGRTIAQRGLYRVTATSTLSAALQETKKGLFSPRRKVRTTDGSDLMEFPEEHAASKVVAPVAVPKVMSFSSDGTPLDATPGFVTFAQPSAPTLVTPTSNESTAPHHASSSGDPGILLLLNDQGLLHHPISSEAGVHVIQERVLFLDPGDTLDVQVRLDPGASARIMHTSLVIEALALPPGALAGAGLVATKPVLPPAAPLIATFPSDPESESEQVDVWAPMVPLPGTDAVMDYDPNEDMNPWN